MNHQRKNSLDNFFSAARPQPTSGTPPAAEKERVKSGAVAAMGASLDALQEEASSAAKLQAQLRSGEHIVALDPTIIDPSPIADRLPFANDPSFDQLVDSIKSHGQQVPILVRPHPTATDRFQIAFGRRRLKAALALGKMVNAVVRELTDDDLVVVQGKENLDRADLSFIEKALFAKHLEDAGFGRLTILAALSTDKSDLSRYIALARQLPEDLIQKVGPAPKAGRARWTMFAEAVGAEEAKAKMYAVALSETFASADSDTRFLMMLDAAATQSKAAVSVRQWRSTSGVKGVQIQKRGTQTTFTFDEQWVPELAARVESHLEDILNELMQEKES